MIPRFPILAMGFSLILFVVFKPDCALAASAPNGDVATGLLSPKEEKSPLGRPLIRKEAAALNEEQSEKLSQHLGLGGGLFAGRDHNSSGPFVTFVIPSKGRPSLKRTLESLIQQEDPAWEAVVVCDPGPCSNLIEDSRIRQKALGQKLGNGQNGAGVVRNEGIHIAQGDFVAYVDDDDTLDWGYVATLKKEVSQSPKAELVVFHMCFIDPPGDNSIFRNQCMTQGKRILPELDVTDAGQLRKAHVGISYAIKRSIASKPELMFRNGDSEDFDQLSLMRTKGVNMIISKSVMYYVSGAQMSINEAWVERIHLATREYAGVLDLLLPAVVAQLLKGEWFVWVGAITSIVLLSVCYTQPLAKIAAFFLAGSGLILLNQHILKELDFSYPMSLAGFGMLATSLFIRFTVDVLGIVSVNSKALISLTGDAWYRKVLPIAVTKSLALGFGNAAYLHLGIGLIQMFKCANPAIVVAVGAACGLARPGKHVIFFIGLIMFGTAIVVHGDLHCTAVGLAIVFASEFFEALHVILTPILLQSNLNLIDGLYILSPPGCVCLFSMAAVFEWPRMIQGWHYLSMAHFPFHFTAAAFMFCAVNILSLAVVQATSALTLKMVISMRSVVLILLTIAVYKEPVTSLEAMGFFVALVGFGGYSIIAAK